MSYTPPPICFNGVTVSEGVLVSPDTPTPEFLIGATTAYLGIPTETTVCDPIPAVVPPGPCPIILGSDCVFYTGDTLTNINITTGNTLTNILNSIDLAITTQIEGTWEEFNTLIINNELKLGQKYLLIDFQTKYFIDNSMTEAIKETGEVTETISGYAYFDIPLNPAIQVGDQVEITYLPPSYSGPTTVGSFATITTLYGGATSYIKFNTDLEYIPGALIKYEIPRFGLNTAYNDATLLDDYGNIILSPDGLVNINVHNDLPYMQMTGEENASPPIEQLILTAISSNQFSTSVESITFKGDLLEYDFNDTEVLNYNNTLLDTRNGKVLKRTNIGLNISLNLDWRAQKYRRYKVTDTDEWNNYILRNSTDHSLYLITGLHAFSTQIDLSEEHKYILPAIEQINFYYDFTRNGAIPNPFLTGVSSAPSIAAGARYITLDQKTYHMDIMSHDPKFAKDFNIFPLDVEYNPNERIVKFKANYMENTTTRLLDTSQGISSLISVETNILENCTFDTGFSISNSVGEIIELTALDDIYLSGDGLITGANFFSSCYLHNEGSIKYYTSGGMRHSDTGFGSSDTRTRVSSDCKLHNTLIGGKRNDYTHFSNVTANKFMTGGIRTNFTSFNDSILFITCIKFPDGFYSNQLTLNTGVYKNAKKDLYGYYHSGTSVAQGKKIVDNNVGDLLYPTIDGNNGNQIIYTVISQSQ